MFSSSRFKELMTNVGNFKEKYKWSFDKQSKYTYWVWFSWIKIQILILFPKTFAKKIGWLDLKSSSEILWVTELQRYLALNDSYHWFGEEHKMQ